MARETAKERLPVQSSTEQWPDENKGKRLLGKKEIKLEQVKGNSEKNRTKHWKEAASTTCSLHNLEFLNPNIKRHLNLVGKVPQSSSSVIPPNRNQQPVVAPASLENCSLGDKVTWIPAGCHVFHLLSEIRKSK